MLVVTPDWVGAPVASPVEPLYDLDSMGILSLWLEYGVRGQQANVSVLDTGVDDTHASFAHTNILKKYFISKNAVDQNGHGTWVCGKIVGRGVGIAPECSLTSYKVLDANGSGETKASIKALKAVLADKHVNIINLSFGSPIFSEEQNQIIQQLVAAGVIVVAASGNYASNTPFYPGSYPNVLTVSATDKNNVLADFSDYGEQIDIVAPGVGCYSTFLNGQFHEMSGTSMATPIVTGLLTLGISYLKRVKRISDRKEIAVKALSALEKTATDLGSKGKDSYYGFGLVNGLDYMRILSI